MTEQWFKYLESIGMKELFIKRAEEVLSFFQKVYPDQIQDIFVTDYLDQEGNRQYESLWLFTQKNMMEAKKFLTEDDFDSTPFIKNVRYWSIKKAEYDFASASTKSRMTLHLILLPGTSGTFKASRENCDYLKTLFLKYFIPNAIPSTNYLPPTDENTGEQPSL